MKKAFIGLLILILSAWAQYVFSAEPIQLARMNPYVAGGARAASCSVSTDYVGSKTTSGTSSSASADYVRCTRFQATELSCSSSTLNTGYLYHTSTSSDNAKIAVFGRASADVGVSPMTDDLLIGTWGTISGYAVNGGYGSVSIGTGQIIKDRWYWVCFITDASTWERVADTTAGTSYYKNIAGSYDSPPSALDDDYTSTTLTYLMYFTVGD
jgi:hypothetical protein